MEAHKTFISEDKPLQKYKAAKNEVRRLIKAQKNNVWDQHGQQIETLIGGKRCSKVWKFIRSLKSSNKDKFTYLSSNPMNRRIITPTYFRKKTEYRDESPKKNIRVQGEKVDIGVETTKKVVMSLKTHHNLAIRFQSDEK
ncbi:hypothetical protein HHI36_014361 [Cryptolaemus montrouzieri]|uniref:Uncharacterized protein n=1 Tax=Cryptolaemus montrouzieri TaxID=559131 RepID=A0ABD2N2D7_9CUCU